MNAKLILSLCLLFAVGCFNSPGRGTICGGSGTLVQASGTTACVYRKSIQVTGFQCPFDFPTLNAYGDFFLCATTTLPIDVQEELAKKVSETAADTSVADTAKPDSLSPADLSDGQPAPDLTTPDSAVDTANPDTVQIGSMLILDPKTIAIEDLFTDLPRGIIRGYDPNQRTCVGLFVEGALSGAYSGTECLDAFTWSAQASRFRLIVLPDRDAPCTTDDFLPISAVDTITVAYGCFSMPPIANFGSPNPVPFANLDIKVEGARFKGTIIIDNQTALKPQPLVFTMRYITDIPEDAYVQLSDALGFPTWVKVRKKGETAWRRLFDGCDLPICGGSGGVCGQALPVVRSMTNGDSFGQLSLTWDGYFWVYDEGKQCLGPVEAEPGQYEAEFCYSLAVDDPQNPQQLTSPSCTIVPFSLPATELMHTVNNGG